MEDVRGIIAQNISNLRTQKNMTQLELAEILSYSDKAISKWERGESLPDVITLKAIADLFGVSLDYMVSIHLPGEKIKGEHTARNNRILISLIAVACLWALATAIYSIAAIFEIYLWLGFVLCVPISCIVLLVFNSIWGIKKYNLVFISILVWSILCTIFVGFFAYSDYNLWMLFLIGIPSQIVIFLCFGIKKPRSKSHKEVGLLLSKSKKSKRSSEPDSEQAS